jgi:hypothetical protein
VVEEIFWEVNGALDTIWQGFSGFTNTVQRGAEAAKVKTDSNFISSISLFNIEKKSLLTTVHIMKLEPEPPKALRN